VIDAISKYYEEINANIHRGVHTLSHWPPMPEASCGTIQNHINAQFAHEVLLLQEPLLNQIWCQRICVSILKPGDEVLVSAMEHHSNIVPWQMYARTGAVLKVIPMNDNGELIIQRF
jgi:cysteine desulfurase/selenocysteine lyase